MTSKAQKTLRRPIYQLKISLVGSSPPVWRRVLVSGNRNLKTLHEIIQLAMGWTNSHLHLFKFPDGMVYTDLRFMLDVEHDDEAKVKLRKLAKAKGARFKYVYDFGDDWSHAVEVEDILGPDGVGRTPRVIAGEGADLPEDVGGVHGYSEFLAAMADPKHERHAEFKEWIGEFWKPVFDLEETNNALRSAIKP